MWTKTCHLTCYKSVMRPLSLACYEDSDQEHVQSEHGTLWQIWPRPRPAPDKRISQRNLMIGASWCGHKATIGDLVPWDTLSLSEQLTRHLTQNTEQIKSEESHDSEIVWPKMGYPISKIMCDRNVLNIVCHKYLNLLRVSDVRLILLRCETSITITPVIVFDEN